MTDDSAGLAALVQEVTRSKKYSQISNSLVEKIASEELGRQSNLTAAIKSTRARLHQIAAAYLSPGVNYAHLADKLKELPPENETAFISFFLQAMRLHASTAERLPMLENFYKICLASIAPVKSVLDLACGLNPLSIPWMPLARNYAYKACDVVLPMIQFLQNVFQYRGINGEASVCDLFLPLPKLKIQLVLLMKTIPLLEQMDKKLPGRILDELQSEHILITYPLKSLGGRSKGMYDTYHQNFEKLIAGRNFTVKEFEFHNEIAFLLSR